MDCVFCRIAAGELPADIVYRDDDVVAFRDLNPVSPHHLLVIPRRHIATLNDLDVADSAVAGQLLVTASRLADQFGFAERGYRLVMNCNADGGQTVFHIHLHLLAGRHHGWPPG
jgi:histidine triad (HIT) family protein